IYDISNPASPIEIGSLEGVRIENVSKLMPEGPFLYVAHNDIGLSIYNLFDCCSDPPGSFQLLTPADLAWVQECSLFLDWEDSAEAVTYDLYMDASDPPVSLFATGLPLSSLSAPLQTTRTFYWKVAAKSACGTSESPVWSFDMNNDDIHRFESKASLAADLPEATFQSGGLPWLDPDNVLDPGAPSMLFYEVVCRPVDIHVVKDGLTVRVEAK
ncbi:hypothetical protein ACFLU6_13280, partial [Acidobacteriota bacterium]